MRQGLCSSDLHSGADDLSDHRAIVSLLHFPEHAAPTESYRLSFAEMLWPELLMHLGSFFFESRWSYDGDRACA